MSQLENPSQVQGPNWVSIPIAKFSHNTSHYATRNFVWNHVGARNDLDFNVRDMKVVDEHGNYANRVFMRITAGTETLESQDLGELVKVAREFNPSSGVEHPLQVVVRSPFLAMRYPQRSNEVRRIQMKFHSPGDFAKAINVLKDLGLPITSSPPSNTGSVHPSPSPATSMFSSVSATSTATMGSSLARPLSMQESSRSFGSNLASPAKSEFKTPALPDPFVSDVRRSTSAQAFTLPPAINPVTAALNRRLAPVSSQGALSRPTSLYEAQIGRKPSDGLVNSRIETPIRESDNYYSQLASQSSAPRSGINEVLGGAPQYLATSPFFPVPGTPVHVAQPLQDTNSGNANHSFLLPSQADGGSGNTLIEGNSTYGAMPPRRDLPFANPGDTSKSRCTSASGLPALPKPTPVRRASLAPKGNPITVETPIPVPTIVAKRVAQRKAPVKKMTGEGCNNESVVEKATANGVSVTQEHSSPLAAKSAAATRPVSATGLQLKTAATKKRATPLASSRPSSVNKRPKMVDQGTQTQTISGRDHTISNQTIPCSETPTNISTQVAVAGPPDTYLDTLDSFITKHSGRPAPIELWAMPGYAETDIETRQALINDFICQNLDDPDFLQLCQDTEFAWRRMGLGV